MRNAVMRKVELGDLQLRHSSRDYSAQLRPRFCPPFQRRQLSNRSQRQLYRAAQYRQGPHQTNARTDPRPIVTLMSGFVRRINPSQESACVNPTHRSPWSVPQKHRTVRPSPATKSTLAQPMASCVGSRLRGALTTLHKVFLWAFPTAY